MEIAFKMSLSLMPHSETFDTNGNSLTMSAFIQLHLLKKPFLRGTD